MSNAKRKEKEEDKMLTITEAAAAANITESAIYNAISRKKLPAHEQYGRKLVKQSELESYLATAKPGRPFGSTKKKTDTEMGGSDTTQH